MARATYLTVEEKDEINILKKRGDSKRQIAKTVNLSEKLSAITLNLIRNMV
jgi:IS30 family transposase